MENERLLQALQEICTRRSARAMEPMSKHTTLRLGGPAEYFCTVQSASELMRVLTLCRQENVPLTLIGNGSNLLVKDGGLRGVTVALGDGLSGVNDPTPLPDGRFAITAGAGGTLVALCAAAAEEGLSGLEFAAGIPGSVGGGVAMNAGAYGGEMKDVLFSVAVMTREGKELTLPAGELALGYRTSRMLTEELIVLSATFAMAQGDRETIQATMREFNARRREKQPLSLPSCGSTFKRPEGYFAGTLIDECGLKGFRVGGCSVSTQHAGFLVNDEEGTAADFLSLMARVQQTVYEKKGVALQPEVRIVGEDAPVLEG